MNLTERSVSFKEPSEPEYNIPDDDERFGFKASQVQIKACKMKLPGFECQEVSFGDLISCIQNTIASHNFITCAE